MDRIETTNTTDATIRAALHSQRLNHLRSQPNTLVVDELGLAHARSRVDVAVINGCIHGYEIKSDKDTLGRLAGQIAIYRLALQKLTIVAAAKHVKTVLATAPSWCGVIAVDRRERGQLRLANVQSARANPDIDPTVLAQLLWAPEVRTILSELGLPAKDLRQPRKQLYAMLAEAMAPAEIARAIRESMMTRRVWRDHPARV